MTDETVSADDLPEPARKGFWSLQSDEESVARGQINFWAMLETALAIIGFGYVALTYETFLLLYTSLFVAPLLFLRSEESVRQGVEYLDQGMFPPKLPQEPESREDAKKALERRWKWMCAGIGLAVVIAGGHPAAKMFLVGHYSWDGFWNGALFFLAMTNLAGAIAVSMAAEPIISVAVGVVAGTPLLVTGALAAAGAGAGAAERAGATTKGTAISVTIVAFATALAVAVAVAAIFVVPGIFSALWIRTSFIRFVATVRFLFAGYRQAPANIEQLALRMAPLQVPELLPGLPRDHRLRLQRVVSALARDMRSGDIEKKAIGLIGLIFFPLIFIPGWAYRVILKSTLWFWWILFIVGGAPKMYDVAEDSELGEDEKLSRKIQRLEADAYLKMSGKVIFLSAIFVLLGLLTPFIFKFETSHIHVPPALAFFLLIDLHSKSAVQILSLISAVTAIAIVFWASRLAWNFRGDSKHEVTRELPWFGHLVKWKSGVGMASIALTMLYFALYASAQHSWLPVSPWAADWLHWLYGDTAQALLGHS